MKIALLIKRQMALMTMWTASAFMILLMAMVM
jgi:hypothetical protein